MNSKIKWGILSTAKIAVQKVIPAMQKGKLTQIQTIASREMDKANEVADKLNIERRSISYEALLYDPNIDAIYNPLPNHLHVPWTIKAMEAGKHVLCEKPIGMNTEEALTLLEAKKNFPRFIFDEEPVNIIGDIDFDPVMKIDRLSSGMLRFPSGKTSTFTCSTQLMPYQKVHIFGDQGQITIEIPVNAPPEETTTLILRTKEKIKTFSFDPADQYTLQGDAFSKAIIEDQPLPTPLDDAVNNMRVIDALKSV